MHLNLHPRRWHLLTWSAFLFWLVFAVAPNIPQNVTYESFSEVMDDPGDDAGVPTAYSSTMMIGWPFTYREYTVTSTSKNVAMSTHLFWLMGNFIVILLVQYCVMYSFQQFGQFSVRAMMLGTLLVALLIFLGRFLLDAFSFWGLYYYICAIYYSPVILAVFNILFKLYLQRRMMTEQRVGDEALDQPFGLELSHSLDSLNSSVLRDHHF